MKSLSKYMIIPAVAVFSAACTSIEDFKEVNPDSGEELVLTASATEIVLDERNSSATALTLSWSTGSNYGTGNAISYTLEISEKEAEYSDGYCEEIGRRVYEKSFSVTELNDFVKSNFGASAGDAVGYKARVTASVSERDDLVQVSETFFTVTAYEPVTTTLYMIGGATSGGWSVDTPTEMERTSPGVFTWTGTLQAGDFRFITMAGNFWPGYVRDIDAEDGMTLKYFASEPENSEEDAKFDVPESRGYTITADLLNLTLSIVEADVNEPAYSMIYFVSEANSWSFEKMTQDPNNHFIFRYGAVIGKGQFKFGTTVGSWENMYKSADKDNADISSTSVQFVSGTDPDWKWFVNDEQGGKPYKIALDITAGNESMVMREFVPYGNIWLIGDAAPCGWSLDDAASSDAAKMTPSTDSYNLTWTGDLAAGELKFSCDLQRDWNGAWFMPAKNNEDFTDAENEVITFIDLQLPENSGTDRKWKVSQAGNYTITINQLTERISIKKN